MRHSLRQSGHVCGCDDKLAMHGKAMVISICICLLLTALTSGGTLNLVFLSRGGFIDMWEQQFAFFMMMKLLRSRAAHCAHGKFKFVVVVDLWRSLSLVVRIDAGFGSAAAFFSGSWWKKGVASLIWFDLLPMRAVVMLHRWHVQDNRWRIRSGSNDSRLSR
ncbi:hypothetical protein DEO72_LG11g2187 [Vigna unguiculata]|uniref:Uncharacterized protein n=1 Tax=Vigna unguiculata TaxID=3917 RepID=A0A4D6NPD6_VIGUN|nr:hypothetical protein DEO72_LG11g2187 [Vigna unguiculata]